MKSTWVLVAGKVGARVFSYLPGEKDSWSMEHVFAHPAGRLLEQEMVSDRAGRSFHRGGDKVSHAGGHPGGQVMHEEVTFAKSYPGFRKSPGAEGSTTVFLLWRIPVSPGF